MQWQMFACVPIAAALIGGAPPASAVFTSPTTSLVSVDSSGQQGDDYSNHVAVSANGRYIAFQSRVPTLVPDDGNSEADIFLRDTATGTVTLVSRASDGTQANATSLNPSISADGRYVAFESDASNLAGGAPGYRDVFIRDTVAGTTTLVSAALGASSGPANADSLAPSISADGRLVAFSSYASDIVDGDNNNVSDIFLRDTVSGVTQIVSVSMNGSGASGNDASFDPAISPDGRHVAFSSDASDLVPNDTNASGDVFVRDVQSGATTIVSVASAGTQGNEFSEQPALSADGRYVVFSSAASNLVGGDVNSAPDIFVRDTATGTTTSVSVAPDGTQGNGASGSSEPSSISADGRYVAFESYASNLVDGDTGVSSDVFVRDTVTGTTAVASVATNGTIGSGDSVGGVISADARYVAFSSDATNLVDADSNNERDVFLRGPLSSIAPAITLPVGVPIKSSPAAFEGSVAFGADDGWLYIADLAAGRMYPQNISDFVGAPVKIRSRPTVYYTSDGGPGWYFTSDRGDVLSFTALGLGGVTAPAPGQGNTGTPAVTLDGQIFVGLNLNNVTGIMKFDSAGGTTGVGPLGGPGSTISSVAVAGNRVYVGLTNGLAGDIVVVNAADLTPLSSGIANGEGVTAPPYVVGENMYVGTLAGNFYKLNSANGAVDTSFGDGGKVEVGEALPTSPFYHNGAFYAGSSKGKVWKIGLDGALSKAYDTWNPSAVVGGVVVERTSNTLAFGTSAGNFYKVPLAGGDAGVFGPTLAFGTTPTYEASTALFFIGNDDGNVYGF